MIKWVSLWMIFVSFLSASYLEELKWPKGETFLTFLEKNNLPLSIYYTLDKEEQELAAAFGIRSIPSLLFVPMEGKPQMAQGAMPKASFKEAIDSVLLKK